MSHDGDPMMGGHGQVLFGKTGTALKIQPEPLWKPGDPLPMLFNADAKGRKLLPIVTGNYHYFPDAHACVAFVSYIGNMQHNPGQPLHWSQAKSGDHLDCIGRHLAGGFTLDTDGVPHHWKLAWRANAYLQMWCQSKGAPLPPGAR